MQVRRKTNLFNIYKKDSTGNDVLSIPQFVTFSNYAESMTGNHLGIDNKLFPSSFICLDIPSLNTDSSSQKFYSYCLISYYENKMAFLRDYVTDNETKNMTLDNLKPLDYLLHYINNFDKDAKITHIGDIVEQNYNGIYSDMLLTVTVPEDEYTYNLSYSNEKSKLIDYYPADDSYLYGWCNVTKINDSTFSYVYNGPKAFENVHALCDEPLKYNMTSYYSYISPVKLTKKPGKSAEPLKFNVVIPLYNINNVNPINSDSNNGIGTETNNNTLINLSYCDATHYVPYGLWWCGFGNYVTLNRNENNADSDIVQPSWSLVLSSQFSAFPYSSTYSTNAISNVSYNTISSDYNIIYHNMFAGILSEQSNLIDLLYKQNEEISYIRNEITALKSRIK